MLTETKDSFLKSNKVITDDKIIHQEFKNFQTQNLRLPLL